MFVKRQIFLHASETIRLLFFLRISSGENNQKSKQSDPSKISLVPAEGALEILGAWALGFFYFRKPDIRANKFSDFPDAETVLAMCFQIMTTRKTGGLFKGYKPEWYQPASQGAGFHSIQT